MLRFFGLIFLVGCGFGCGFYFGIQHRNQELIDHPELLFKEYEQVLRKTASDKYEKVKKALAED